MINFFKRNNNESIQQDRIDSITNNDSQRGIEEVEFVKRKAIKPAVSNKKHNVSISAIRSAEDSFQDLLAGGDCKPAVKPRTFEEADEDDACYETELSDGEDVELEIQKLKPKKVKNKRKRKKLKKVPLKY